MKAYGVVLSAIMMVTASIFSTVAYLKDSMAVKNTFTVGKVSLRLDEAVVNEQGVPIGDVDLDGKQERTKVGNHYHLVPGKLYVKDPTMTLEEGSEESYVRMLVTINCYEELVTIFGDSFLLECFIEGWNREIWEVTDESLKNNANNTATYEFRYYKTVQAKEQELVLEPLFTDIHVPDILTREQLAMVENLEIVVEGHAIQKTGFENVEEAWAHFKK